MAESERSKVVELREYWKIKKRAMKFKNEATMRPSERPGIEKESDCKDIKEIRLFY